MVLGTGCWMRVIITALCLLLACRAQAELKLFLKGTDPREISELQSLLVKDVGEELALTAVDSLEKADLAIIIGADVLRSLPEKRPPVLLLDPTPSSVPLQKSDGAVYWSPSLAAQLSLTRYLLPATNRIGMLVGNRSEDQSWLRVFKQYAAAQSIDVRIVEADPARLARQIAELATHCDVLLAQPDVTIYNRDTIRLILLAAYRQNRVLIGPGPAFVRAGSLASLYAPPARIAEAVAQSLRYFSRNERLPAPYRLKQFSVSLNAQVARSLGLTVPAVNELERLLRFEELPTWP